MNSSRHGEDKEMHPGRGGTGENGGGTHPRLAVKASKSVPEKLWGCIAAPPKVPCKFPKKAYLFFLAFFLAAILFSSELFRVSASVAVGARIQSSCLE